MNYIKTLQEQVKDRDARIATVEQAMIDFQVFLGSAKFTGTDPYGDRKDWIATGDVQDRLRDLRALLTL